MTHSFITLLKAAYDGQPCYVEVYGNLSASTVKVTEYSKEQDMSIVDKLLAQAGLFPVLSTGHKLRTRVMRIGPPEAAALLVANHDNRKLRPGRTRYYARVMTQGGWRLTHQGIAFCVDGRGLDLQHRLHAIISSGVTIDMMVTEGLSQDAFDAIDQHERRTVADALRVERSLADVARMLIVARGGTGRSNPTILEVGEVVSVIDDLLDCLMKHCNTRRAVFATAPVRAAALILMYENPTSASKVLENYRMLVLNRSEEWPRVMHAFNRQAVNGDISTHGESQRLDLMARALVALDPKQEHLSRIQIDSSSLKRLRSRTIRFIGAADDEPSQDDDVQQPTAATEARRTNVHR